MKASPAAWPMPPTATRRDGAAGGAAARVAAAALLLDLSVDSTAISAWLSPVLALASCEQQATRGPGAAAAQQLLAPRLPCWGTPCLL